MPFPNFGANLPISLLLGKRTDTPPTINDGDAYPIRISPEGFLMVQGAPATTTTSPVLVGGRTVTVSATLQRPNDTNAYAAGDVVANATTGAALITFTNLARVASGDGYITGARLMINNASRTGLQFRVHMFKNVVTAQNDNALYSLLWANRANRIGSFDFDATVTEPGASDAVRTANFTIRIPYDGGGDPNIYVILQTLTAYTPAANESYFLELTAEQN